jgi:hypothetical protein
VDPFDLQLLRSVSVSRPIQGDIIAGHPFPTSISRALAVSTASTPPWAIAARRIKAFNRSNHQKLAFTERPIAFLLPEARFFRYCFGSKLQTRFVLLGESFREPPACWVFVVQQDAVRLT